tara:strand:- start:222 stop:1073 length:852 start_codon:yes stop_codon:yes gene_type:complete
MAKQFTWGEALDYTLKTKWAGKAGLKTNVINTGHFTEFAGRSFPVARIDQIQMDLFCAHLRSERGISNATINRCITAVGTVINCCAKRKMCEPAPVFEKHDEGEVRMFWFNQEQVDDMAHAAFDPFFRQEIADIILTAAYTGMREGELLKLKVQDIDLGQKRIHVGGVPHLKTKAKNYRTIPIHPRIMSLLCDRLEHASPNTKVFDDVGNKDQLLLAFKKVRDYAQAPAYTFHDLRHSFGTWHAIAGTPMRTLMGLMGHKRIETTLRYAKHTDSAAEAAMAAI